MAESSKTLEAGAAHNINGTTNINLVYQQVFYAGTQKEDQIFFSPLTVDPPEALERVIGDDEKLQVKETTVILD